ncbi:hypothetical protein HCMG_01532 [Helicobacter canadensis MIT 98-5491]|uniref:Uncharacterized protein n=1 Tax=Helicobacter canadensis MIT 98-5491 TaxID=537970 RepID=C5ZYI2_9HELI|nr:hypothetical protein HCAN_1495 [Helicobacter canadensis MIT 98-5491]EFR49358.1 hypothetical protein HCMG_01532 [Helicobacter canadensis MIT 98-5491]
MAIANKISLKDSVLKGILILRGLPKTTYFSPFLNFFRKILAYFSLIFLLKSLNFLVF